MQSQLRKYSTERGISEIKATLAHKRIYFYALPLTTKKTFLHCKYNDSIFPGGKKNLEEKLISKFMALWNNFSNSDSAINKKIVVNINKVLSRIPWLETCLLSIPSQKFITRKLKEDAEESKEKGNDVNIDKFVTHEEILSNEIKNTQLEEFEFYYPGSLTNRELMINNFKPGFKEQYDIHKKGILKDLLLLPLTIPFAIIPLIPNIPGFYLLYRVYCHIKVIASLKFLVTLLKDGHFNYVKLNDEITDIYLSTKDEQVKKNLIEELAYVNQHKEFESGKEGENEEEREEREEREEKLLISEDVVKQLCEAFNDKECENKLLFAIKQEREQLRKEKSNN